jgi:hypothetical protein
VRAIYSYGAQGDDELSFKEGELIELTSGPTGGQGYGDGWWEGTGIFFCRFLCLTYHRFHLKRREGDIPQQLRR